MNKLVLVLIIALIVGAGVYAYSRQTASVDSNPAEITDSAGGTQLTSDETGESPMPEGPAGESVKIIEVEAGSFYFKPNELRVKKGETVTLVLNSVSMMHDFVIDELNIRVPVTKSGEKAQVQFTADTEGEYEFYCSVGNHREQGQVGKLIVEQ